MKVRMTIQIVETGEIQEMTAEAPSYPEARDALLTQLAEGWQVLSWKTDLLAGLPPLLER